MTKNNNKIEIVFTLLIGVILVFFLTGAISEEEGKKGLKKTSSIQAEGDSYRLNVNKINLPFNSRGKIADVLMFDETVNDETDGGRIDGKVFLFSSGFVLSGYNESGVLWTNAMASASRVEDYIPGTVADGEEDPRAQIYVVRADEPFGDAWTEWSDAVDLGANFVDGDGDGIYNPVDLNGNGEWDENEDSPDILGDETTWCVFNDGVESTNRRYTNVDPQGIEVRQTMWAYATSGDLGNIVFIRYSLLNTGTVSSVHDSVYFALWADPDLGGGGSAYTDDLVGSDTTLNAGFIYNDGDDEDFGKNPPSFLIDFFQGPWEFTGNAEDRAYNTQGLRRGIDTIEGAKNLGLTAFVHYGNGVTGMSDPDDEVQMRNYLLGKNQNGELIDPCNWDFGDVLQMPCEDVDPTFLYSGDPVALQGWINNFPADQRMMLVSGPFKLEEGQSVDIVGAYVVGRGNNNALEGVKLAKKIDRAAQFVFQNNFNFPSPPPAPDPIVIARENEIELIWETKEQFDYVAQGIGFDMTFEAYEVYMYQTNSTAELESGRSNRELIARYDVANNINTIIQEDAVTNERTVVFEGGTQLDSAIYSDPETGRIRLTIDTDPFTGEPLIKGRPYFISIVSIAVNQEEIVQFDALGTYMIPGTAAVGSVENIPSILTDELGNVGIVTGGTSNEPYFEGLEAEHTSGVSEATINYSVVDKSKVNGGEYTVDFFVDSLSTAYSLFYKVTNSNNGVVLDSSKAYDQDEITTLVDGVTLNVQWIEPGIKSTSFEDDEERDPWFKSIPDTTVPTGALYVGGDIASPGRITPVSTKTSNAISASDMRRVELRFGETSKAFRYVRDPLVFRFAGDDNPDEGFVDVPFAAYIVDPSGEQRRLAVGFTESNFVGDSLAQADGVWNPFDTLNATKEYIAIFNGTYSDDYNDHVEYTGLGNNRTADIQNGYNLRNTVEGATEEKIAIAKSPWFDAMYVVGLERLTSTDSFEPYGTLVIEPESPLTTEDVFTYTTKVDNDADDVASQWDKVNVYPNPLFGYNEGVSFTGGRPDEPYVTFNNLPEEVEIKIFTLSGVLIRTLSKLDSNPNLEWDLLNESGLRVASGMYIAMVSNPELGDKVLKLAIVMPQKQIENY